MTTETAPVTQADSDLASWFERRMLSAYHPYIAKMLARHRIEATRELEAQVQEAADNAATFCIETLAEALGNPDYVAADGSEEWEGDVAGTIYNVLIAAGVLDENDHRVATHAQLAEARGLLESVQSAMLNGGDGQIGDYGWSITKLNLARPLIRAFLARTGGEA